MPVTRRVTATSTGLGCGSPPGWFPKSLDFLRWREHVGIEPTRDAERPAPVLKTVGGTSHPLLPWNAAGAPHAHARAEAKPAASLRCQSTVRLGACQTSRDFRAWFPPGRKFC